MDRDERAVQEQRFQDLAAARNGGRGDSDGQIPEETNRSQPHAGSQSRISLAEGMLMVAASLIFDGASALAALSAIGAPLLPVIAAVSWLTFFLWFHMKGMSYGASLRRGLSPAKNPMVINAAAALVGSIGIPPRTAAIVTILVIERGGSTKGTATVSHLLGRTTTR